jgi:leader peptidase (prepilin peptidase)/N-methyltransferase
MNSQELLHPGLFSFFIFLFGLLIGKFLNVVIQRMPHQQPLFSSGKGCPKCSTPTRIQHQVPVLGFLLSRGKCAGCGEKISLREPLVEILTGFLFLVSFRNQLDMTLLRTWVFISLGIAITFIDLDHRIIPDELSIGGMVFGLLTAYWDTRHGVSHLLLFSLGGVGVFTLFAMTYEKITGREGFGGGDIKYVGTIGAFLGFGGIWSSIVVGSITGLIVGTIYAKIQKNENVLRAVIPFGPFMVFGAFLELFFEISRLVTHRH